jgi:GNAT superfamily N-acetyltransferase
MAVPQGEIVTTYLEMTSRDELRAKRSDNPSFSIREIVPNDWQLNRRLYLDVGELWSWNDKRAWSDARWQEYVATGALRTFIAEYDGAMAGYFELRREDGDIEIAYFGLLPEFIGRGLGGPLLSSAIEEAWRWNASRVWVHTCTLDHPAALRNYQARGFRIYKTSSRSSSIVS